MDQTLLLGFTQAAARKARETYQAALGIVLILEAAAGLALVLFPASVARVTGDADSWPWLRPMGVALLLMVVLFYFGRREPACSKLINMAGIFGRLLLAVVLALSGGARLWAGAAELIAALVLAQLYFKLFEAEVMSRP